MSWPIDAGCPINQNHILAFKITTGHESFICRWTGTRSFTFTEPSARVDVRYDDFYQSDYYDFFFKLTGKPYMICDSAVCKMYVSAYLKWKKGEVNVTLKQHYAKKKAALHFGVLFDKLLMAGRSEDQSY